MNVEINMLNVEDGDAIIVMLQEGDKKSLILIDGGYKKHYTKLQKRLQQLLPLFNNKIDLLICTHYDNDHIGGVEKLLDDYHNIVEEIWIHKIDENLVDLEQRFINKIKVLESNRDVSQHSLFEIFNSADAMNDALVLEGYKDLLRVIGKIKSYGLENKIKEAVRGTVFQKFPQFTVISPTSTYYNSNLPDLRQEAILEDLKANRKNSSKGLLSLQESYFNVLREAGDNVNACDRLEVSSLANSVSPTNMVSIVTLLNANNRKYLFTGDSGIESFIDHTPNWDNDLKNLFFLDVAHHGSKNNTSRRQIDVFNPEIAFVSGDNGPNRPSLFIRTCLTSRSTNRIFEVTNSDPNTWYLKLDNEGNFERIIS